MMKLLCLIVASASAFQVAPLALRRVPMTATMGVAESAEACLEEGCSVDTVDNLIADLKAEYKQATNPDVFALIQQLEKLAIDPEANKNQIEKIAAGAARTFSVVEAFDFPGEPLGYTGKVGTTTTAGKALD